MDVDLVLHVCHSSVILPKRKSSQAEVLRDFLHWPCKSVIIAGRSLQDMQPRRPILFLTSPMAYIRIPQPLHTALCHLNSFSLSVGLAGQYHDSEANILSPPLRRWECWN